MDANKLQLRKRRLLELKRPSPAPLAVLLGIALRPVFARDFCVKQKLRARLVGDTRQVSYRFPHIIGMNMKDYGARIYVVGLKINRQLNSWCINHMKLHSFLSYDFVAGHVSSKLKELGHHINRNHRLARHMQFLVPLACRLFA